MAFRWREEKGFEVGVKYWGLNDINSYKAEDFSEEAIKRLGYEENGIKKIVEKSKKLANLKDSEKYQETVTKIDNVGEKKKEIGVKINQCTHQVRKLNKLIANDIKRLDYTQKFFIDIIRTACIHIDYNIMKVLEFFVNYVNNETPSLIFNKSRKIFFKII